MVETQLAGQPRRRRRGSESTVQGYRALAYAVAVALAAVARLAGQLDVGLSALALYAVVTLSSTAIVAGLVELGPINRQASSLHRVWLSLDVVFFVWGMMITGGSASPWFPWALASVTSAGAVAGWRTASIVAAAHASGFAVAVGALEGSAAVSAVLVHMAVLYGAGFAAIAGVVEMRDVYRAIGRLREVESRRAAEVRELTTSLEERSRLVKSLSEEVRKATVIDRLTGLHNRRYLQERIDEDVAMVRRAYAYSRPGSRLHLHNSDLGVVLIDIDNLHRINETHGDEVGDEVLIQLGAMLGRKVRQHDSVVRWDGDTFMALLRQVNRSGMRDVVERLQQWIREESFTGSGGQRFAITCSSGYCHYPLGELGHFSWEDIVKVADAGLRLGRQAGGDVAIGVSEGPEPIDTTGAPLVVEDLAQAAEKGYVRLLWERQPGEDESTVDS